MKRPLNVRTYRNSTMRIQINILIYQITRGFLYVLYIRLYVRKMLNLVFSIPNLFYIRRVKNIGGGGHV